MVKRRGVLQGFASGVTIGLAGCSSEKPIVREGGLSGTPRSSCGSSRRVAELQGPVVITGKTNHVISLPPDVSRTVEIAATELQSYIKEATGAELSIERSAGDSRRIALTVDPGISPCGGPVGREAFTIDGDGRTFELVGATPRAVLYGVYDILEQDIGVRWAAPGPNGEHVPNIESLTVTPIEGVSTPDFGFRVAGNFHSDEYVLWAIRNKLHIPRWPMEDEWPGVHSHPRDIVTYRDSYVTAPTTHTFDNILPPSEHRDEHPEWYSENQLDITNDEVRDAFIEQVRSFFEAHPEAEMCPVTPNDGYGWPDAASSKSDLESQSAAGHPTRINHHQSISEAYFRFVVDIADWLKDIYPEKKLYAIAYTNYVYPPVTLGELPDNVIVSVAHYTPADYAHTIGSDATEESQEFASILEKWATKAKERWMYCYTVKYALDALPQPIAYRLGEDIEFLYQHGYMGLYSQGAEDRWGQYGPHFYVMAKKLWNHSLSVDALLTEYFEVMAGDGASEARTAYDTIAKAMENATRKVNRFPLRQARSYLTSDVIETANRNYRNAIRLASRRRTRANIEAMRLPLSYSRQYFRMREALQTYESVGRVASLRRAVGAWNDIRNLFVENQDLDSLPLSLIAEDGYFTLQRHFRPHMEKIDTNGGSWSVNVE